MQFLRGVPLIDILTSCVQIEQVRIESDAEHQARVQRLFEERKAEMREKHLLHEANRDKRLDGRVFSKQVPTAIVRPIRKRQAA